MATSEESSDPPPPDIPPPGDHTTHQHTFTHDRIKSSFAEDHLTTRRPTQHVRLGLWALFAISALLLLPTAKAQTYKHDPFTSPPDPSPARRQTPLLDMLSYLFSTLFTALHTLTGWDVFPAARHGTLVARLTTTEKVEAGMIPVLVAASGVFAGLTLGYFSIDQTQLHVLSISGNAKQQKYARKIIPIRKNSHLLLTTLVIANMGVNEALPVVMDSVLGGGITSVIISTALVVIFAEIIPQSVCSRFGLLIGAAMAWPVRVMMFIFLPIAWPIAKLLEWILGAHHGIIYRRSELRELIRMHGATEGEGGDLDMDTITMAQGALDLAQKTVKQAMTPIDKVFMLPIEAKLDYETLGHVVRSGHSRIPVYQMLEVPDVDLTAPQLGPAKTKRVKKVMGTLLVKSCVLLDPEDATPLATIPINAIPSVPFDEPLTNMLNVFQDGRSHMAIVSRRPRRIEKDLEDAESVMTAAAGGLRQRFMKKVAGISHGNKSSSSGSDTSSESEVDVEKQESRKDRRKRSKKAKRDTEHGGEGSGSTTSEGEKKTPTKADEIKDKVKKDQAEKRKGSGAMGIAQKAKLSQLEQTVPADAQMAPDQMEKFFEGLEGAPIGIITLEDVLEQLIGEPIEDEYDQRAGDPNPASSYIPPEAAIAARKAALAREKALAEATPLPPTNDADLESPVVGTTVAPTKRPLGIPKLPALPRLALGGGRPRSQPGKPRLAMASVSETPKTRTPPPVKANTTPATPQDDGPVKKVGSTSDMISGSTAFSEEPEGGAPAQSLPHRSASEARLPSRSASLDAGDTSARTAEVPLKGLDAVTAVPQRLIPGTTPSAAAPTIPPSNLLDQALMIERGRRRLGPAAGPVRVPSSTGLARTPVPPSRIPTPPTAVPFPTPVAVANPLAASTVGPGGLPPSAGVLSPIPRRGQKFKSVPTPLSGTPVPPKSGGETANPMEAIKTDKGE